MTEATHLKLENQICFPLYAVSRLVIQQYKPLLSKLEITYPQYLVLLVLWEKDNIFIKEISNKLFLETNTLTPLLKRMESQGLISRNRSKEDERSVTISLTKKGKKLQELALDVPEKLTCKLGEIITYNDAMQLKGLLDNMLEFVKKE